MEHKNFVFFHLTHFYIYFLGWEITIPLTAKGKNKVGNYYPSVTYHIILLFSFTKLNVYSSYKIYTNTYVYRLGYI